VLDNTIRSKSRGSLISLFSIVVLQKTYPDKPTNGRRRGSVRISPALSLIFNGMKVRLWKRDIHLLSGPCSNWMCFVIVLLMKHCKNIFPRNFSRWKNPDNMSCGKYRRFRACSRCHWKHGKSILHNLRALCE